MEFTITIQNNDEVPLVQESGPWYGLPHLNNNTKFTTETAFGRITSHKIQGQGFTIWIGNYFFEEEVLLNIEATNPVLFFHLVFSNSIKVSFEEKECFLSEGQFNISSFPQFELRASAGEKKQFQTFHIHFEPDFLKNYLNGSKELKNFILEVHRGNFCSLSEERHFATAEMMSVVESIIKNPYEGRTGHLFIASQVNVLLLLAIHKINQDNQKQNMAPLSNVDKEKLAVARAFLTDHWDEMITTQKLTKVVGMNDHKLKKGFKQLFGKTIYSFQENIRLQKAMRLLIESDLPVGEIGMKVGYLYPQHFSFQFKKKFGFPPTYFRKP